MAELTVAEYWAIFRQAGGEPEAAEDREPDRGEADLFDRPPPHLRAT